MASLPFELRALEAALLLVAQVSEREVLALEDTTHPGGCCLLGPYGVLRISVLARWKRAWHHRGSSTDDLLTQPVPALRRARRSRPLQCWRASGALWPESTWS